MFCCGYTWSQYPYHPATSGDSVVLQTAIPVDPTLQVLQATPTHSGQIYTTPVGATVVNYNPVPVAPSAPNPAPNQPPDWYKEQKITNHPTYIQSKPQPHLHNRLRNDDIITHSYSRKRWIRAETKWTSPTAAVCQLPRQSFPLCLF